jgi:hypothetical protein
MLISLQRVVDGTKINNLNIVIMRNYKRERV